MLIIQWLGVHALDSQWHQCLKVLKSRLFEREMKKRMDEQQKNYGDKQEIAWGSQIRSYVLHPYNMVKDHRTDHETSNATGVLDGDLDEFMEAYLRSQGAAA